MTVVRVFLAVALAVCMTGCATIVASGPDHIAITSNPKGARIFVNGEEQGATPSVVTVHRKRDAEIRLELPGYEPVVVKREQEFNGWVVGNICLGGIIGLVVDILADNFWTIDETPVAVRLTPVYGNGQYGPPQTYVPGPNDAPPPPPPLPPGPPLPPASTSPPPPPPSAAPGTIPPADDVPPPPPLPPAADVPPPPPPLPPATPGANAAPAAPAAGAPAQPKR